MAISLKALNVLHSLVTHPDRLIPKDTLLDTLWAEMAVSDAVVRVTIRELRKALGDTAQTPQCIGLDRLRQECPHFRDWMSKLAALVQA